MPVAAEQVGGRQRAVGFVERERVIAALAEHLDQRGVGDRRGAAGDGHGAAVDEDGPGRIAAGRDRVVESVAELGQKAGGGVEAGRYCHCGVSFSKMGVGGDAAHNGGDRRRCLFPREQTEQPAWRRDKSPGETARSGERRNSEQRPDVRPSAQRNRSLTITRSSQRSVHQEGE